MALGGTGSGLEATRLGVCPDRGRLRGTQDLPRRGEHGGLRDLPLDVRVIASSNRDLKAESESGRFRLDRSERLKALSKGGYAKVGLALALATLAAICGLIWTHRIV